MNKQIYFQQFLIASSFCIALHSFAQNGRLKYADKMYDNKGYYYASQGYEDVLERKVDSSVVSLKLADSYDKIGEAQKARDWYNYMYAKGTINKEQLERLALLERQLGNFDKSNQLFQQYEEKYGANDVSKAALKSSVTSEELSNRNWFDVTTQAINSASSDMSVIYLQEGKVLFASAKRRTKAVSRQQSWTGGYFYDLYIASLNSEGAISSKKVKLLKKSASKYNDGPASFSPVNNTLYFTRNGQFEKIDGKKKPTAFLSIYKGKLIDGKLKEVTALNINMKGYSSAHPSVSADGKQLYFSSNRPNGNGGMDLYVVSLDEAGNPVGEAMNLGSTINTSGDEVFPFYSTKEQALYFSSNGHFGLGGLDVFGVKISGNDFSGSVNNLGSPINSLEDDFAFVRDENSQKGFVSSNRPEGKGSDDIYAFVQKQELKQEIVLKGVVTDEISEKIIENTLVYLQNGNGEIVDSTTTDVDGNYMFKQTDLEDGYKIVCTKDRYNEKLTPLVLNQDSTVYENNVKLLPKLNYRFQGKILDVSNNEPLEGVKVNITDVSSNKLLGGMMQTKNDGSFESAIIPNKYKDEVSYTITFEKAGYEPKSIVMKKVLGVEENLSVLDHLSKVELKKDVPVAKVEKPVKEAVVEKIDLKEVAQMNAIYYDLNSSFLTQEATVELDKIVVIMNQNPTMVIEVRAHTDCRADNQYNLWLSNRRAQRAAEYIQAHISNGASRVSGKGFGESQLLINCGCDEQSANPCTEEQHLQNRRTEFIVIKK